MCEVAVLKMDFPENSDRPNSMDAGVKEERLPRAIWVLVAAAVAIALGYGIVAPVLPQYAKSFSVTNLAATFVVSAFALLRLSFAPASGWLSTKFGERRMYLFGIAIVMISSFASAFAQSYLQLLIFRAAGGIGSVTFSVAAMSMIFKLAPPTMRGRASAAYGAGFLIGNIAGPAVGALLSGLGYRWPFLIYGCFLIIAWLIVKIAIGPDVFLPAKSPLPLEKSAKAEKAEKLAKAEKAANLSARPVITVREALQLRRFRITLLTAFSQGWTNMGVRVSVIPLLALSLPTAAPWLAGGLLTTFAFGNALALWVAGKWSDVSGRRHPVIFGLLLSGFFTLGMGIFTADWVLLLLSFWGGFGSGCVQPSQQGAVADIIGDRSGNSVVSFFQMAGDFGQIIGPLVAGFLIDISGFALAYWISGGILLLAALFWIFDGQRHEKIVD